MKQNDVVKPLLHQAGEDHACFLVEALQVGRGGCGLLNRDGFKLGQVTPVEDVLVG